MRDCDNGPILHSIRSDGGEATRESTVNADGFLHSSGDSPLDLNKNNSTVKECSNGKAPYLLGLSANTKRAVIFRARCKMWGCPECAQTNAWVWSFRASEGAHALYDKGHSIDFVTITPHEKLSSKGAWWVMPKAWMKLQARLRRTVGTFQYFQVPELHESGKPHIHMITTAKLPESWWKDNARECGFGYMSDVQEVWSDGGVITYVLKYITKTFTETPMPKGAHRVRTSRGWPKHEREPLGDWTFKPIPKGPQLDLLANQLEGFGYDVFFAGPRSAWSLVRGDTI